MAGEGNPSGYAIIPTSAAGGVIMGAGTNNTVAKFTGSDTIGDSSITDNGTAVTVTTNLIDSGLTASRILLSNSSKQLVSNAALTTNVVPKAASSGASLADSTITDSGTLVSVSVPTQTGRHLVSGFTPTAAVGGTPGLGSTGTLAIQTGSTDEAGKIVLSPAGAAPGSTGNIVLTFSTGSAYGGTAPICIPSCEYGPDTWPNGSSCLIEASSTTSVTIRWNSATSAAATALVAGNNYIVSYICFGRP